MTPPCVGRIHDGTFPFCLRCRSGFFTCRFFGEADEHEDAVLFMTSAAPFAFFFAIPVADAVVVVFFICLGGESGVLL